MKIIISLLQVFLFNLWDAATLAISIGALFRIFNWIVPMFEWKKIREDKKTVLSIMILLVILYMLPGILRGVPRGGVR